MMAWCVSTKARAVHFHSSLRRVQIDLVMVTSGGYYAFAVERRPNVGGALFAALMAILLVILGACAWQRANSSAN